MGKWIWIIQVLIFSLLCGCVKVKHDLTIQPIHVTVEVKIKIDKELSDFFDDIDSSTEKEEDEEGKKTKEEDK